VSEKITMETLLENEVSGEMGEKLDLDYEKIIVWLSEQKQQYRTFKQLLELVPTIYGIKKQCHEVTLRGNLSKLVKDKVTVTVGRGQSKKVLLLRQAKMKLPMVTKKGQKRHRKQSVYFVTELEQKVE
jgi:hypothetical protein